MRANVDRRIAALESKSAPPRPVWSIFTMHSGVNDESILGFQHQEHVIMREPGETLQSVQKRASAAVAGRTLDYIWTPVLAKSDKQGSIALA
jgi:hypothetical protein